MKATVIDAKILGGGGSWGIGSTNTGSNGAPGSAAGDKSLSPEIHPGSASTNTPALASKSGDSSLGTQISEAAVPSTPQAK